VRSLRTWLAVGLVLGILVPLCFGALGWVVAGSWQTQRQLARRDAATKLLASASLDDPGLADRLSALGVEAELKPVVAPEDGGVEAKLKFAEKAVDTPGLRAVLSDTKGKDALVRDFTGYEVDTGSIAGTVWVRHESAAARWAIALGAAGVALAGVLFVAVALLSRWVLRPLATLARDADRIAGGELVVEPVLTRASEVAQVGDALAGMAGALERALVASAAGERERRFLVSAIAHDLRTPLFTLRGSLEAIERGIGDAGALARAQRKADHLDRLVGDLFSFSRAEYAREALVREPLVVVEVARRAAETMPGVEIAAAGPVPLLGDPGALERVLTNVLENAVRHARSCVRVVVDRGGVVVTDDGPGFADADLPHVFEPLFRGDRARSGGGAGLGLAIARRLARAHGGEVTASNGAAGGAVVTVTLPFSAARASSAA
jgi:signal transduction histidine kinase